MPNKKLAVNMTIFFVASMVVNAGYYVYQLLMSRFLIVENYGLLNSIVSFYTIISIPLSAIGFYVIRYTSLYLEQGNTDNLNSFKHGVFKNINKFLPLIYLFIFLFSPLFMRFLKVDDYMYFLLPAITAIIFSYQTFFKSVVYGERKMGFYSIIGIVEIIIRIIGAVGLVYMGYSYLGAFGGFAIGGALSILFMYIYDKDLFKFSNSQNNSIDYAEVKKFILPTLFITIITMLLNNFDVMLAKTYLSDYDLGIYSTVSIFGKITMFVLGIFVTFGQTYCVDPAKNKKIIALIYGLIIAGGLICILFYSLIPEFLVNILFGAKYALASGYLGYIGMIAFMYSLLIMFLNHMVTSGKKVYSYVGLVLIVILPIVFWANKVYDIQSFLKNIIYFYVIYLAIMGSYLGYDIWNKK